MDRLNAGIFGLSHLHPRSYMPIFGAVKDFQAFARTTGHELIESTTEGNVFRFVLKHKA